MFWSLSTTSTVFAANFSFHRFWWSASPVIRSTYVCKLLFHVPSSAIIIDRRIILIITSTLVCRECLCIDFVKSSIKLCNNFWDESCVFAFSVLPETCFLQASCSAVSNYRPVACIIFEIWPIKLTVVLIECGNFSHWSAKSCLSFKSS